jgi:hypothetical protein
MVSCVPDPNEAATKRSFSVEQKYNEFSHLLFVYVWHVFDPDRVCAYALSIGEALKIAHEMQGRKAESWVHSEY